MKPLKRGNELWSNIKPSLQKVREIRPGQYEACCPVHEDKNPSLSIALRSDGTLLFNCWSCGGLSIDQILESTGADRPEWFKTSSTQSIPKNENYTKVSSLAELYPISIDDIRKAKKLKLEGFGLHEIQIPYQGVAIPYYDYAGKPLEARGSIGSDKPGQPLDRPYYRVRTKRNGKEVVIGNKGERPEIYGLQNIDPTRPLILCEGETDTMTLTELGIPAIGCPGATLWSTASDRLFQMGSPFMAVKDIYIVKEWGREDTGEIDWSAGEKFAASIIESLIAHNHEAKVKVINFLEDEVKDPSDLWIKYTDPLVFREKLQTAIDRGMDLSTAPPQEALCIPLSTIIERASIHRPWIVKGFICRDEVTVLAADPGAGKSSLMADLSTIYASGADTWFDRALDPDRTGTRRTLVLDNENPDHIISDLYAKHEKANLNSDRILFHPRLMNTFFDEDKGRNLIEQMIRYHRPDLVVIDTLRRFLSRADENKATGEDSIGAIIAWLSRIARSYRTGIVFLHHTNKRSESTGDMSGGAISGSQDIRGAASASYILRRQRSTGEEKPMTIVPDKTRGLDMPMKMDGIWRNLKTESHDGSDRIVSWSLYHNPVENVRGMAVITLIETIEGIMREEKNLGHRDLCSKIFDLTGRKPGNQTVYSAIADLKEQGKIYVMGDGTRKKYYNWAGK